MLKAFSKLKNNLRKNLIKNNRGQGATEYILLLAIVVAIVVMFKGKISDKLQGTVGTIGTQIDGVVNETK